MRNVLFMLPVLLFVALAGYFALALRPDTIRTNCRRH